MPGAVDERVLWVAVVVLLVLVLVCWGILPNLLKSNEYYDEYYPDFTSSLTNKYRDYVYDKKGMTVNDYDLENMLMVYKAS